MCYTVIVSLIISTKENLHIMEAKILVVDDEKEIADLIELYLSNESYEVHKFYNGKEVLSYLEHDTQIGRASCRERV